MDDTSHTLVHLHDDDMALADPADDIRGRKVVDRNGDEVGDIDGLVVDEEERRVRFLEVGWGAVEARARTRRLVPVDVIRAVDDQVVHISSDRAEVAHGPVYDPGVGFERSYYAPLYGYFDCPPFWWPGYSYPTLRQGSA